MTKKRRIETRTDMFINDIRKDYARLLDQSIDLTNFPLCSLFSSDLHPEEGEHGKAQVRDEEKSH